MLIFFLILIASFLSIVFYTVYLGISPMPSSVKAKQAIEKLLPQITEGEVFELGAGWGSLLEMLGKRYPHVVAIEHSPIPFAVAWLRTPAHVQVVYGDFFKRDLSDAGLVVCYLFPEGMARLKDKFERELKSGCWVISNTFAVPGWTPVEVIVLEDLYRTKVYLYKWSRD